MREIISEQSLPISFEQTIAPIIWVSEFDPEAAQEFFASFITMQSDDAIKEIFIYIDSFGGAVDSLSVITELVENSIKPIATVCLGKAMSAGGILACLGSPGRRWVGQNSRIMMHRLSSFVDGDSEQIKNLTNELVRMNEMWLKKAVSRSKMTWIEFNTKLNENGGEWYMTPKEAIKYGFADHIGIPIIKEIRSLVIEVNDEKIQKTKKSTTTRKTIKKK
jgi:ATP-dependent Clp protease protease subunit